MVLEARFLHSSGAGSARAFGLVLALKLARIFFPDGSADYETDHGRCVSCARCFSACPYELVRRGVPVQLPPEGGRQWLKTLTADGRGSNDPPPPLAARQFWARTCARIALIAGVFALMSGRFAHLQPFRLYRGPGNGKVRLVEARELLPLKAALREDPKNEPLKQQIRQLDQQLRHEYFRREQLASRGGWLLLGSAAVFPRRLATRPAPAAPACPDP